MLSLPLIRAAPFWLPFPPFSLPYPPLQLLFPLFFGHIRAPPRLDSLLLSLLNLKRERRREKPREAGLGGSEYLVNIV